MPNQNELYLNPMNTLDTIDIQGKRVLLRVDYNVPLDKNNQITDDTRIRRSLDTIDQLLKEGASVIIVSHLGRPDGTPDNKYSLGPVSQYLKGIYGDRVKAVSSTIGEDAVRAAENLEPGQILLLENVRFYPEETAGDLKFAKKLADLADVYVNDAFGTAHRAHASTSVVAQYFDSDHKAYGRLMEAEIKNADKVLKDAERPFTAIIGGAKVSDKILIIERLLDIADHIIIGGGMAYTFFKAEGGEIGNSLVEDDKLETARQILATAGDKIILPEDSIVADKFAEDAETGIADNYHIPDGWMGLDIGIEARNTFTDVILKSKTILWNGPMGVFEMEKFASGTEAVAEAVAKATDQGAFSLVGGGDSVSAVNKLGYAKRVSYISTGGGAMLEYFEGKELPGVASIMD